MRVMITQGCLPQVIGGIGTHAAALAQAIIREGVEVRVLTAAKVCAAENGVIRALHTLFDVPPVKDSHGRSFLKILQGNRQMAAAAGDISSYDVIHCQNIFSASPPIRLQNGTVSRLFYRAFYYTVLRNGTAKMVPLGFAAQHNGQPGYSRKHRFDSTRSGDLIKRFIGV